ncbi:class I SAM-dependent methyltransferase [Halpernia sp. GG3]
MEQKKIADFYDNYVQKQLKIGANERLISLFKRLINLGLNKNSKILELGCGVGIFTKLLASKISMGKIEAVDLSKKSIKSAKTILINKKNIHFATGDVVKYEPENSDFHFITLMDVIEHIPLSEHDELFKNLAKIATEKTQIIINIPNPKYISYLQKNKPESLQIIDQSVELIPLIKHLENADLEIIYFEKYSIWLKEDYHFMVIRKNRKFSVINIAGERSLKNKILNKISKKIDYFKYS